MSEKTYVTPPPVPNAYWELPDNIPLDNKCLTLKVPNDPAYFGLVTGALWELMNFQNYDTGELDVSDVIDRFSEMFVSLEQDAECEPMPIEYPTDFLTHVYQFKKTTGSDIIPLINANHFGGLVHERQTSAIGDKFICDVWTAGGYWDMKILCNKQATAGIVTCQVDGAYSFDIDLYNGTVIQNQRVQWLFATYLAPGFHQLSFQANSKHAAATNYKMPISAIYGRIGGDMV